MKGKHGKSKHKKGHSKGKPGNMLAGNYITVTEHAVQRYRERFKKMNDEKAHHTIVESVKRSRLIALTKFGGREIRENRGVVFVCELQGNQLYVITVLISRVDLRFVS